MNKVKNKTHPMQIARAGQKIKYSNVGVGSASIIKVM